MANEYAEYMDDPYFRKVYTDWRDAVWEAGDDLPALYSANLTFQAWFGKYKADHDPYFGKPITVEMQEDVSRRCAPIMAEFERTHEMLILLPNWENRSGSPDACYKDRYTGQPKMCGYCSGRIVGKHDKLFNKKQPMDMQQQAGWSRVMLVETTEEGEE